MALERTFSILKPDATARNLTGAINAMIEAGRPAHRRAEARAHLAAAGADSSTPCTRSGRSSANWWISWCRARWWCRCCEGDNAIAKYRELMGATDPAKAAPGTIRKVHAKSIGENSVHGSDAPDTAAREIAQFFSENEIVG